MSRRIEKATANAVYIVGVCIAAGLGLVALFGSRAAIYPDAMIPWTWREAAFLGLAVGAIPMFAACFAAYRVNGVKTGARRRRDFTLIFLPGFVCGACALYLIAVIVIGMINLAIQW